MLMCRRAKAVPEVTKAEIGCKLIVSLATLRIDATLNSSAGIKKCFSLRPIWHPFPARCSSDVVTCLFVRNTEVNENYEHH